MHRLWSHALHPSGPSQHDDGLDINYPSYSIYVCNTYVSSLFTGPHLIVEVLHSEPVSKVPEYKGTVLLHLEMAREVLPTISRGRKHNNTNKHTYSTHSPGKHTNCATTPKSISMNERRHRIHVHDCLGPPYGQYALVVVLVLNAYLAESLKVLRKQQRCLLNMSDQLCYLRTYIRTYVLGRGTEYHG